MAYRLHDSLGFRLSRAARIQERRLDDGLKELGLTRTTWCVLLAVGIEGHSQPSEIAGFVGIDRTATSRALRQMEDAGLIERKTGEEDARTRTVQLTEIGEDRLRRGEPIAIDNNHKLALRIGDERVEELCDRLDMIIEGEPLLAKL